MKCALCGGKMGITDFDKKFQELFEFDLKQINGYELKKLRGDGNYCPKCIRMYISLRKGINISEAYSYFKAIVSWNCIHENIDVDKFVWRVESLHNFYTEKEQREKENKQIASEIEHTINRKKQALKEKYGISWVFPRLPENGHVCATKYNDSLIMIENYNPQFNFTESIENSKKIQDNVDTAHAEELFMATIIPLENIVSYQLIGDVEHIAMVSGGGGGGGQPNLHGAVVGGLLFGGAGAIIGAQTGICINPIKSTIKEIDSRVTMLNLKNSKGQVEIRELPYYYSEVFMKVIPEKEFNFLQANKNAEKLVQTQDSSTCNMLEEMKQLKELLDLNLITQEEYNAKRQQILKL